MTTPRTHSLLKSKGDSRLGFLYYEMGLNQRDESHGSPASNQPLVRGGSISPSFGRSYGPSKLFFQSVYNPFVGVSNRYLNPKRSLFAGVVDDLDTSLSVQHSSDVFYLHALSVSRL